MTRNRQRARRRVGRCWSRGRLPTAGHSPTLPGEALADALTASTRAYQLRLSVDLVYIETLLRDGDATVAAGAVEDERRALEGLAADLHEAVALATRGRRA